jgi:hypothetical protein
VPDIFLSYAREDRPWASRLAAGLIENGWSLFWDAHIPVGQTFDQVIERQLEAAGCIIVLWSRHSVSSNWVKAEASEGARRGILHPVLIENVRLPLEFRRLQTANLIDWQRGTPHGEFDRFIGGIAATLRSSRSLRERLQEARAALGRGDGGQCLEILGEIADAAEAAGSSDEVAELRRTAEARHDGARREELRRQRARCEEHRAALDASRSQAQAADAATRTSALWLAAEAKMGEVAAAFDDGAYLQAAEYCKEATALYGQAAEAARKAARREEVERQRHAAEQGHARMVRTREAAQSTAARERASALWNDAEQRATEGQAALAGDNDREAERLFDEAARLYERAERAARDVLDRERQAADASRTRMAAEREAAQVVVATPREGPLWSAAETAVAAAEATYERQLYGDATNDFERAAALIRAALDQARAKRDEAARARAAMAECREAAHAGAPHHAQATWADAEAKSADGESAFQAAAPRGAAELPPSDGHGTCAPEQCPERAEALSPDLSEATVIAEGESSEPLPPALPGQPPTSRPTWRLGGSRLVAGVGAVAVVLSVLGIYGYWPAPISGTRPSPVPPEQAPSPTPETNVPPDPKRERGVADDLREKAAAAREQATNARAELFANTLFAAAARHQGAAEAALDGGRVTDAQEAYRQAIDGFAVAATEAHKVIARKQDETGRLQMQVEDSRRTAAAAQAAKHAGPQWTRATNLHWAAQAAVARGDHDKAGALLREAIVGFGNAAKAATVEVARLAKVKEQDIKVEPAREVAVGPPGPRADAEQARWRMAAAKREAEQVAAGFFAHKRFTSAQNKERDGMAALGQSDYGGATRLLGEAQSEYQAAVQEARREAEKDAQIAPARARMEQARAAAATRRQQALAAEANHLARDAFEQAQARHLAGDELANRQDLAGAAGAYQDAAQRYGEATVRARTARAAK